MPLECSGVVGWMGVREGSQKATPAIPVLGDIFMCTESQHHEKMAALGRIETLLTQLVRGRPFIDQGYQISDTQGFALDYKNRRHIFMMPKSTITLDLKSLGQVTLANDTWTNIDYREGFQLFTTGTASAVSVLVRATDEWIA